MCVSLDLVLNFSVPQFPFLHGHCNSTELITCCQYWTGKNTQNRTMLETLQVFDKCLEDPLTLHPSAWHLTPWPDSPIKDWTPQLGLTHDSGRWAQTVGSVPCHPECLCSFPPWSKEKNPLSLLFNFSLSHCSIFCSFSFSTCLEVSQFLIMDLMA